MSELVDPVVTLEFLDAIAVLALYRPASQICQAQSAIALAARRRDSSSVCGGVRLSDLPAKHKAGCGACGPAAAAPC